MEGKVSTVLLTTVTAEGENHPGASLESRLTDEEGSEANKCLRTI